MVSKPLVINSDADSGTTGTFTVATGKTITSNKSDIAITAWDVEFIGTAGVTAGTRTISIHGASASQTIGLGATAGNMHVAALELQRTTASNGLHVGNLAGGTITVNNIAQTSSNHVTPVVTLVAAGDEWHR